MRDLFGADRKISDLDYNEAVEGLSETEDKSAKAAKQAAFSVASPAVIRSTTADVKPHAEGE